MERLVAGDPETEQHFAEYFGDLLTIKLRTRLRSPAQAEDARQETFRRVLTTLKQRGGLKAAEHLGAFVNGVCNNVLFEVYRAGSRTDPLPDEVDPVDESRPSVESGMMAAEDRGHVQRALAALPQKEKDLLRWLFFEERDKDEVCAELGIDRNYLRVLLHRAKGAVSGTVRATAGITHGSRTSHFDACSRTLLAERTWRHRSGRIRGPLLFLCRLCRRHPVGRADAGRRARRNARFRKPRIGGDSHSDSKPAPMDDGRRDALGGRRLPRHRGGLSGFVGRAQDYGRAHWSRRSPSRSS